jgi:membrane-associated phospholipid phosphatase
MNEKYLNFCLSKSFLIATVFAISIASLSGVLLSTLELSASWMVLIHSSPVFPTWFWSFFNLGGDAWVALLMLLWLERRPGEITSWVMKTWLLGAVLSQSFKHLFPMPRPAYLLGKEQLSLIDQPPLVGGSMPSGHALAAICCGLILIAVLKVRGFKSLSLFCVGLVSSLVAWSRVAVGAHWPLDVFAGAALAFFVLVISSFWERRNSWNPWFKSNVGGMFLIVLHLLIAAHLIQPQSKLLSVQVFQFFLACLSIFRALVLFKEYSFGTSFVLEKKS